MSKLSTSQIIPQDALGRKLTYYVRNSDEDKANSKYAEMLSIYENEKTLPKEVFQIGDIYIEVDNSEKARALYQQVLDEWPESEYVFNAKAGFIKADIHDGYDEAAMVGIDNLMAEYMENTGLPHAVFSFGEQYWDFAQSEKRKLPQGRYANRTEGDTEKMVYYYSQALTVWEIIINQLPESQNLSTAYKMAAEAAHAMGEYETALKYFKAFVENWPDDERAVHCQFMVCSTYQSLIYSNYFFILINRDTNKLMFNEPGKYKIEFPNQNQLDIAMNKPTNIEIKPASEQEKKALSLLTGKDDLMILVRDNYRGIETKYPGVIDRYKKVVEQCPDTMISKLAATCIGMVLYNDYEEQRIVLNLNEQYKLKTIAKEAMEYLEKGLELPDEFPIRENILYMLTESEIEVGEKDYSKAIAYLEELSEKYPYGRWGKSALSGLEEVKTMMANDPNWANRKIAIEEKKEKSPKKPLGVALPIAGAAVAVIAIAGLFIFSRKKKLGK